MIAFYIPLFLVFSPTMNSALFPITFLKRDSVMILGILLAATGRVLSFCAVPQIRGRNGQRKTDDSLISGGIFSISRNPIALGMILTFLGLLLLVPSLILFIGFLIFTANIHFRIRLEEDFMKHRFGNEYMKYRSSTRRYL
jgi:protein-S-isoprenylcysteine O-methyltransferase Ste14